MSNILPSFNLSFVIQLDLVVCSLCLFLLLCCRFWCFHLSLLPLSLVLLLGPSLTLALSEVCCFFFWEGIFFYNVRVVAIWRIVLVLSMLVVVSVDQSFLCCVVFVFSCACSCFVLVFVFVLFWFVNWKSFFLFLFFCCIRSQLLVVHSLWLVLGFFVVAFRCFSFFVAPFNLVGGLLFFFFFFVFSRWFVFVFVKVLLLVFVSHFCALLLRVFVVLGRVLLLVLVLVLFFGFVFVL